jgi:hypothetical protein
MNIKFLMFLQMLCLVSMNIHCGLTLQTPRGEIMISFGELPGAREAMSHHPIRDLHSTEAVYLLYTLNILITH